MTPSRPRAPASPRSFLPLRPVDFLVLLSLHDQDRYGYGLVREIAKRSRGRVRLVPGNLYSVLRRLLERGIVAESDRRPTPGREDVRRRYYTLTPLGREVLTAEARRLKELVQLVEDRRLLGPEEAT